MRRTVGRLLIRALAAFSFVTVAFTLNASAQTCASIFDSASVGFLNPTLVTRASSPAYAEFWVNGRMMKAFAENTSSADFRRNYFDILDQLMALTLDDSATTYYSSLDGSERKIQREAQDEILKLYMRRHGRWIPISSILLFHLRQQSTDIKSREGLKTALLHPELAEVVKAYRASHVDVRYFSRILQVGRLGYALSQEDALAHSELWGLMRYHGLKDSEFHRAASLILEPK